MILASQLTERVTIERPTAADDGYGGKTIVWESVASVFANVKPVLGAVSERQVGDQRTANAGYRIIMRARSDVTAAMRLQWKNRTLLIHSLHESDAALYLLAYEENI